MKFQFEYNIYFGLDTPDGYVTFEQFKTWLSTTNSMGYLDGYILVQAEGRYLTLEEDSVILKYLGTASDLCYLQQLATEFKKEFEQDSVFITRKEITTYVI